MEISVIIPVYNAATFLEKAVCSALEQAETGEVILIEDGSQDNSRDVCRQLSHQYKKVHFFQHSHGINRGAAASRNLGIRKANHDWIAFLDADDYFLPQRFEYAKEVFAHHPDADGVYEALGIHFHAETSKRLYEQYGGTTDLTTLSRADISPSELFSYLVTQARERFSIDALVIKKELAERIGRFDESLRQAEDTDFIWRLALFGKLYPGSLNRPVAKRLIHGHNQILNREEALKYRRLFAQHWFDKMLKENWSTAVNRSIFRRQLDSLQLWFPNWGSWNRVPLKITYAFYLMIRNPWLWQKLF